MGKQNKKSSKAHSNHSNKEKQSASHHSHQSEDRVTKKEIEEEEDGVVEEKLERQHRLLENLFKNFSVHAKKRSIDIESLWKSKKNSVHFDEFVGFLEKVDFHLTPDEKHVLNLYLTESSPMVELRPFAQNVTVWSENSKHPRLSYLKPPCSDIRVSKRSGRESNGTN